MKKVIAFAGSTRTGSLNEKLLRTTISYIDERVSVELLSLKDYDMPIFNGDLEHESGLPEAAKELRNKMIYADGFIFATPEYNGNLTPLLKNTLDWLSRPLQDEKFGAVFRDKVTLLISTSPGPSGGSNSVKVLNDMLKMLGAFVSPYPFSLAKGFQTMDEEGALQREEDIDLLKSVVNEFISLM